jgi:uncharacterized oxidoreductase
VESNLVGLDSHGVMRIPQYVELIRKQTIKPGGEFNVINDKGSTAILDCGYNFGQVGGTKAVLLAIERAKRYGISCVITKNCNHAGRLGAFTQIAAEAGMIALATCNSPKHGHWVAPFGGREGRLATNPFSFAAPSNSNPIVLDMSTSAISEGKVRVCLNSGEKVPLGSIADAQGMPTDDPKDFYGPPVGSIMPFGGSAGYKGTGLGMMVEILSGTLSGEIVTDETLIGNGLCFIVINIANFVSRKKFQHYIDELVKYIKSSLPAEGNKGVFVPGELDFNTRRNLIKNGIEIDNNTWKQIETVAQKLSVSVDIN